MVRSTEGPDPRVRDALDALVHATLVPVTLVVGTLFAFFVLVDPIIYPSWAVPQIVLFDALCSVAFYVAFIGFQRKRIPPALAHPVAGALATLASASILHDLWLVDDPSHTLVLILVVLGCGAFFLSHRWVLLVLAATLAGWGIAVAQYPDDSWTMNALGVFAASVVAVLIQFVRVATHTRLERLRILEAERRTELERREDALRNAMGALTQSEDRYRRLVEDAPDAFLVHSEGRVVYVNPACIRLFGAERAEDLLGRDSISLSHPDDVDLVIAQSAPMQEGGALGPFEMRVLRVDGAPIEVEVIGQPITFMERPAAQTLLRDITDRKRAEQERHVAAQRLAEIERLREMDEMKTRFVNTVSHELRTPLTPIKVQLHLLKASPSSPEKQKRAVEVLERNFLRLAGLLDELLEVARIQAGRLQVVKQPVDLAHVLRDAAETYADVGRQAGVTVTAGAPREPLVVLGDAKRLSQVMDNLLGNALKFTPAGGSIHLEARAMAGGAVVLVRDTGAGMSPAALARLFEPFSQVHNEAEGTKGGTGLGLYICKGLVEAHGGRIWAESEGRGLGSTFAFQLPLAAAEPPVPAPRPPRAQKRT
jgi:PAS domain S-box-containing protein